MATTARAGWLALAALLAAAAACAPASPPVSNEDRATTTRAAEAPSAASSGPEQAYTHYLEFRARLDMMFYGHTYMVYGRLDESGKPAEQHHIGLLPEGGVAGLVVGTVIPMPGQLGSNDADRSMPVLNTYRRPLTAAQYRRLLAAIEDFRKSPPDWSLFGYNCNRFAGLLATAVGLKVTATSSLLPVAFVEALRQANEGEPPSATPADRAERGAPPRRP